MRRVGVAWVLCVLAAEAAAQVPQGALQKPSDQPIEAPRVEPEHRPEDAAQPHQSADSKLQATPQPSPLVPSVHPEGGHREGQGKAQEGNEEGSEFWPPIRGYRLKITDTIIAAFTALLFFATVALWWATRRLVKGADKTAERQLRAYIGVRDGTISTLQVGRHITGTINIQNFGVTPGFRQTTEVQMGTCSIEEFAATQFRSTADVTKEATHWPGASTCIRYCLPNPLSQEDVERMARREYVISVIGRVEYVDAFDRKRHTNIKMFSFGIDGGFNFATDGNEAT